MVLLLRAPPLETLETFERAVVALANHPDQDPDGTSYGHLPPLRKSVLTRQDAIDGNIASARLAGWQYLLKDSCGLAVVDISDGFTQTFTSVRRGPFAETYEATLHAIDSRCGDHDEEFSVEVLEVPQFGSCAMLVRDSQYTLIYPLVLAGKISQTAVFTSDEFFSAIVPPRLMRGNSNGGLRPIF